MAPDDNDVGSTRTVALRCSSPPPDERASPPGNNPPVQPASNNRASSATAASPTLRSGTTSSEWVTGTAMLAEINEHRRSARYAYGNRGAGTQVENQGTARLGNRLIRRFRPDQPVTADCCRVRTYARCMYRRQMYFDAETCHKVRNVRGRAIAADGPSPRPKFGRNCRTAIFAPQRSAHFGRQGRPAGWLASGVGSIRPAPTAQPVTSGTC